jgi:hypothetical protein
MGRGRSDVSPIESDLPTHAHPHPPTHPPPHRNGPTHHHVDRLRRLVLLLLLLLVVVMALRPVNHDAGARGGGLDGGGLVIGVVRGHDQRARHRAHRPLGSGLRM